MHKSLLGALALLIPGALATVPAAAIPAGSALLSAEPKSAAHGVTPVTFRKGREYGYYGYSGPRYGYYGWRGYSGPWRGYTGAPYYGYSNFAGPGFYAYSGSRYYGYSGSRSFDYLDVPAAPYYRDSGARYYGYSGPRYTTYYRYSGRGYRVPNGRPNPNPAWPPPVRYYSGPALRYSPPSAYYPPAVPHASDWYYYPDFAVPRGGRGYYAGW